MDRNEGGREGGRSGISEGNDGVEEKGNAKNEGGGRKDGKEKIARASLASSHGKQFLNVTLSLGMGCTPRTALCRGA